MERLMWPRRPFDVRMLKPADVVTVHRVWRGWRREIAEGEVVGYLMSRRIQTLTGMPENHVALVKGAGGAIVEAVSRGVEIHGIEKYLDGEKYRVRVLRHRWLEDRERFEVARWAAEQARELDRYGWGTIVKIRATLALAEVLGIPLKMTWRKTEGEAWICSEIVQCAFRSIGIELAENLLMPGDFYGLKVFEEVWSNFD